MALIQYTQAAGGCRWMLDPPIWIGGFVCGYWQGHDWHPGSYRMTKIDVYEAHDARTWLDRFLRRPKRNLRIGFPVNMQFSAPTLEGLISRAFLEDEEAAREAVSVRPTVVKGDNHMLLSGKSAVGDGNLAFSSESEIRAYVASHLDTVEMPERFVSFTGTPDSGMHTVWKFDINAEGWLKCGGRLLGANSRQVFSSLAEEGLDFYEVSPAADSYVAPKAVRGYSALRLFDMRQWSKLLIKTDVRKRFAL